MNIIFCEECGSRNTVEDEILQNIEHKEISCQVCNFLISAKHLINQTGTKKIIDTSHYKLLIIDDDTAHLTLLQTTLMQEYTVHVASSGAEGLKKAITSKPDIILLDVAMPYIDGYEVCSTLKSDKRTRHIPIIFVTAKTEGRDEYRGLSMGAVDYIAKPCNINILNAKIASHLKYITMRDELQQKIKRLENHIKILKEDITSSDTHRMATASKRKNADTDTNPVPLASGNFSTTYFAEFNDAISTLLVSADVMCNMYKNDKNLTRVNQYINDAYDTLRRLFHETRNKKKI
ncbi:MAG: hypothetical protein CSA33_00350 [Desulfobulbus propionicus]|nr:MAG: hypothetical protein CSA33_00350 [Desulfobulbus propionicus]